MPEAAHRYAVKKKLKIFTIQAWGLEEYWAGWQIILQRQTKLKTNQPYRLPSTFSSWAYTFYKVDASIRQKLRFQVPELAMTRGYDVNYDKGFWQRWCSNGFPLPWATTSGAHRYVDIATFHHKTRSRINESYWSQTPYLLDSLLVKAEASSKQSWPLLHE